MIPYSSFQSVSPSETVIAFPAVPAGHRLVIQHVGANLDFQSWVNNQVEVYVNAGAGFSSFLPQFSTSLVRFDQPVQLYVNAGAAPQVIVLADSGFTRVSFGEITLIGYLLDCTAAPCAQIAQ